MAAEGAAVVRARRKRSTTIVALAGCFIAANHAYAQPLNELIRHTPGDGDVLIRRVDDIPPLVRDALKGPAACRPAEHAVSELGILTFQPAPAFPPMTLVPCESIVARSSVLLFDRGIANPPSVMKFPPRLFVWNAKTRELIGYAISDMIATPWYVGRDLYRHSGGGEPSELNGFALVARERGEIFDGFMNWQPIPEALPRPVPNR
jgi:hypothetical protein